jgi:hypothetical protein
MTEPNKKNHNANNKPNPKSLNARDKRKFREESIDPNAGAMDLEFANLKPQQLLTKKNHAAASSNQNATYYDSLNPNDLHSVFQEVFDSEDDNKSLLDFTGHDDRFEQLCLDDPALAACLFLAQIDLADTPICPFLPFDIASWPSDPEWDNELPYTREELDNKRDCAYEDSLECHLRIGHEYISDDPNIVGTVKDWMMVMLQAFLRYDPDNEGDYEAMAELKTLQRMAIRLSLSNPVVLFPSASWKNCKLTMKSHGHAA